jgi:tetratricopeptide (TPR) repeat protein
MSSSDDLFSAITPSAETIKSQQASIANYNIQAGVRMLQNDRAEDAIPFFKRALAADSSSVDAYNDLGSTYLKLNKTDEAIATYKKLVAMKPFDSDAATSLANAYAQAKKYPEAEAAYKKAISLSPNDVTARYSLGQTYLLDNKLSEAENEFQTVIRQKPRDANGYYALGATYNKMGKYDQAVSALKQSVSLKNEFFTLAETELGYAYAGKGDEELLQRQIDRLNDNDKTTEADELESATLKPKFTYASSGSYNAFNPKLGPNTSLALLTITDAQQTLSKADASKNFTMDFYFNTDMDVASVQNIANWKVAKASGGQAGYYNYGHTQYPDREASLPIIQNVAYNVDEHKATVTFSLTQNANADAVIDPSHLVFSFSGKDAYGKEMDKSANAYDGFAGTPISSPIISLFS